MKDASASAPDGGAPSTTVSVDVFGELAELDGRSLLWDSAHPPEPLLWNGAGAVVTEQRAAKYERLGKPADQIAVGIATARWGQETLHKQHVAHGVEHEKDRLKELLHPVELRPAHIRPGQP